MMHLSEYKKNIFSQDDPIKFVISKILMRTHLCKLLTIKRKNYRLRFYPSAYSRTLWLEQEYTNHVLDFVQDYVKKNDVLVDVGANIGVITLECAHLVGSGGLVYSVEPHYKTFEFLYGNIKLNGFENIKPLNYACGEQEKNILFSDFISDDQNCISNDSSGRVVHMIRLDKLIPIQDIPLLKIDVEGYEKYVLLGSEKILGKISSIYFETIEEKMKKYKTSIDEIFDILIHNDFSLFRFSDRKQISQITRNYKPLPSGENLIAIKDIEGFIERTNYDVL